VEAAVADRRSRRSRPPARFAHPRSTWRAQNEREETGGNGMRDARARTQRARKDLRWRINGGEASLRDLSSLIASSRRAAVYLKEQMCMAAFVTDPPMISRLTLICIPREGRRGARISFEDGPGEARSHVSFLSNPEMLVERRTAPRQRMTPLGTLGLAVKHTVEPARFEA
jgi:hypothetical protein